MGMGVMSLINFFDSFFFDRNYYTMRYSRVIFFISISIIIWEYKFPQNKKKKS